MSDISRGSIKVKGFKNPEMDFQLIRQMGASNYQAASIGECLNIANQIQSERPEEWVQAFEKQGQWQKKDGLARLVKNNLISGREQLLRACNSFRAAEYYSPCSSEHHRKLGLHSAECFKTAMASMDLHFEEHHIPYKNINIPAYFFSPFNDGHKRRTILIVSGFDGTLEEEFLLRGFAGIERGYNVIHFAGPGQMDIYRKFPETFFEPDFEGVVKRVIDHFATRQEVDLQHLGLVGVSIGGYFAGRAASREPRIKALVLNSPVIDVHAYLTSFVDSDPSEMPDEQDFTLDQISSIPDDVFPAELKVRCEQLMIRYGKRSFKKTFEYLKEFKIGDAISHIECPVLALIGSGEIGEPRKQFDEFCRKVTAEKYEFNDFEGAGTHCQVGNVSFANAVMYDWFASV